MGSAAAAAAAAAKQMAARIRAKKTRQPRRRRVCPCERAAYTHRSCIIHRPPGVYTLDALGGAAAAAAICNDD